METAKIIGFNNNSVFESIRTFIDSKALKSNRTANVYQNAIERFFLWHTGKKLNELKIEDLQIENEQVIRYQLHLKKDDRGYSNTTINTYTAPIISLYEFLSRNRNYYVRKEDVQIEMLPDDGEKYGELMPGEAEMMAQLALKQRKGIEKAALIRLAYRTSFRKSSLLVLTWNDFKYYKDTNCYIVNVTGKGNKKHNRSIPVDLYNEISKIKEQKYYVQYEDERVFHISDQGIIDMMKVLRTQMGFTSEDKIVFHSFRNVVAGHIMRTGGSIEDVREQLNHSGYSNLSHYLHNKRDYANMPSMTLGERVNKDLFESLSKEELLYIIFQQSEGVLLTLQKEIINKEN